MKNLSTGQLTDTKADFAGFYSVGDLAAGDYEISASADGISGEPAKVTLIAGTPQTLTLKLTSAPRQQAPAAPPAPSENLPNAPSSNQTAPSLADLGFSKSETQSNAAQQALLDKRTHMLKIHQRMGLITTIPMVASVVTSLNAGGRSEGTASRDLHVALGALTGDLYGITACYAIRAPKGPVTETCGPIRFHKAMAWIHGPGMILTPILGAMAFSQKNNGEKVHGLAAAHGPVAIVTAGAFGAALMSVSATAQYKQIPFEVATQGEEKKITGTIPTTLTDFKIDPPSLLTLPVKNDIPVRVEMIWSQQLEVPSFSSFTAASPVPRQISL